MIGGALALIGTGGVLGIAEKALQLRDQLFPHAYLQFAGFADNARALKLSIDNTGADELLVGKVFFQPVDDDLVALLGLGNLTTMSFEGEKRVAVAETKVPKGRHPVIVEISSIVPSPSLRFFNDQARQQFFADNGGKQLRIVAEVTRRGRTVTIYRDVTLKELRPFIANRASSLDVTEQ
jgi:hypothetical protein